VPVGYWQCTAFDQNMTPYTAGGATVNEAAYNATYDCGQASYQGNCYIPQNYCRLR
jgi:hypothetical protein